MELTFEEEQFYWREVTKLSIRRCKRVYLPRLFGVPAWSVPEDIWKPALQPPPVERARPRAIRLGYSIPRWFITTFNLHFVKQKTGVFCLTLEFKGEEILVFKTEPCTMSWVEFALYMEFALTHECVVYIPLLQVLVIHSCLGIHQLELIAV